MPWDRSAVIVVPLASERRCRTGTSAAGRRPANRGRSRRVRTCRWDSRSGSATAGSASSRIATGGGSPTRTAGSPTARPPLASTTTRGGVPRPRLGLGPVHDGRARRRLPGGPYDVGRSGFARPDSDGTRPQSPRRLGAPTVRLDRRPLRATRTASPSSARHPTGRPRSGRSDRSSGRPGPPQPPPPAVAIRPSPPRPWAAAISRSARPSPSSGDRVGACTGCSTSRPWRARPVRRARAAVAGPMPRGAHGIGGGGIRRRGPVLHQSRLRRGGGRLRRQRGLRTGLSLLAVGPVGGGGQRGLRRCRPAPGGRRAGSTVAAWPSGARVRAG